MRGIPHTLAANLTPIARIPNHFAINPSEFDPVQTAFETYRKTQPRARLLPTPADAWMDHAPQPADGLRGGLPGRDRAAPTVIPIKALVADGDGPETPRTEITCGELPDGFAQPGQLVVGVALARDFGDTVILPGVAWRCD